MSLRTAVVLSVVFGVGGVARADGPVWVRGSVGATPAVRAAVDDLYARAVADGLQEPAAPPPVIARIPKTKPAAEVATLLRDGEDAFFAIELGRARTALGDAWEQLRSNPLLLADPAIGPARVTSGLLTLVRAHLHDSGEAEAEAVLRWLLATVPDAEISEATQPANVVDLAERVRATSSAGRVAWEVVGPAKGCRLVVHGVDRGASSPVTVAAGETVAWVRCGDSAGWARRMDVPSGGVATLRSAPAAEAQLQWDGAALVPTGLEGEAIGAAVADVARALGAPVVAALGGEGALSLVEVQPDGAVRAIETVPAPRETTVVIGGGGEESGAMSAWGWATLGVGAALLAGGGALHAVHDERAGASNPSEDDLDAARTLQGASIGLYAAGGAALATGVVLLIVDATSGDDAAPVVLGPGQGGAVIFGRF